MSVRAAADQTYDTLKTVLAEGRLPANVADTAVKLCHRLKEPVRVSVMGLPGSGKSTVVNLLLNKIVVPDGVKLPTAQFLKGDTTRAVCTLADGSTKLVADADPHDIAAYEPMFVEFQMPLPALGRISVLEVVAPASPKEQQRAMHWAARRTDMAIWCTQSYTSIEQALWGSLPEPVKDHSFMLLTCADLLAQQGTLEQTLEEIRFGAGHEFNKIMPIATTDAIAARRADGSVDKPLMQKSGGLTLISSILRQVDQGLQATVDQADLILHKFRDTEPNPDAVRDVEVQSTPRIISRPLPETDTEEAAAAASPVVEVVTSKPVASGTSQPVIAQPAEEVVPDTPQSTEDAFVLRGKSAMIMAKDAPTAPPAPKSEPLPAKMGKPVAPVAPAQPDAPKKARPGFMPKTKTSVVVFHAKPETCAAYKEAVTYLTQQGRELTRQMAEGDGLSSDALMEASNDNVMWLSDHLDGVTVTDDPVLEKARTRALDASELIQLMQFESNEDAGIEALTLVIQLKRDLEAAIAFSQHVSHVKAA